MTSSARDVIVRPAVPGDVPAIGDFARRAVHDTYDRLVGSSYSTQLIEEWWTDALVAAIDAGLVSVAAIEERIVGLVEVGTIGDDPVVWKLYVDPDRRGRGLGPRLLDAAEAIIDPTAPQLLVEHIAANERAARFYEREGFTVVGTDTADDPRLDTVWRVRRIRVDGEYRSSAEFHEVQMGAAWDRLARVLAQAFGAYSSDDLIVDVGAGSGVGVVALAHTTAAEIVALEPDTTMRSMLLARADGAEILDRVTVLPGAVPDGLSQLPAHVRGVVAGHMLGHLSADRRRSLFDWTIDHLEPDGTALFTVGTTGDPTGAESIEERRVGRHRYRITHRVPAPDAYESFCEVIDDSGTIRTHRTRGVWHNVTADDVRRALAGRGRITEPMPGVVLVRV